jgi:hypothetical protein
VNEPTFRSGEVASAALLIGGVLVAVIPRHALGIAQLVVVTMAVVAGRHLLARSVPPTGWLSPFKWMSPFGRRETRNGTGRSPDGFVTIQSKLYGWRHPFPPGLTLPPGVVSLLKPLVRDALDLEPEDEVLSTPEPSSLSPLTQAILRCDPPRGLDRLRWLPPDSESVAQVVLRVLGDLYPGDAHSANRFPSRGPNPS